MWFNLNFYRSCIFISACINKRRAELEARRQREEEERKKLEEEQRKLREQIEADRRLAVC